MNDAAETDRLPPSIGGLLGFALTSWAANAPLYVLLTVGVFAAYATAEYVLPPAAHDTQQEAFKLVVLQYTGFFVNALVVATVAFGVAARAAAIVPAPRKLLGGAVDRWLPVIAVIFLAESVVAITFPLSGLVKTAELSAGVFVTAPLTWILWGIVGLAAPFVALGPDRAAMLVVGGFGRAFTLSLQRKNFVRLCVLALVTVLPVVLEIALGNVLEARHVPRWFFWANVPLDALTVTPLAAIQTAFALDFARRASGQRTA